jgi:hypothetical protein
VLEKVHGANFCFITDTKDLICARRTDVLDESETFYDWQKVRNKLKDNILELANEVKVDLLVFQKISHFKGKNNKCRSNLHIW